MAKLLEQKFNLELNQGKIKADYLKWSFWLYHQGNEPEAKRIKELMKKHKIN